MCIIIIQTFFIFFNGCFLFSCKFAVSSIIFYKNEKTDFILSVGMVKLCPFCPTHNNVDVYGSEREL